MSAAPKAASFPKYTAIDDKRQSPDSVKNPIYDKALHAQTEGVTLGSHDFKKLPTESVDVASLVSAQPDINPRKVDRLADDFDTEGAPEVYVVKVGGKNLIWDGNHRVNAARLAGIKTLQAKVLPSIPSGTQMKPMSGPSGKLRGEAAKVLVTGNAPTYKPPIKR